MADVMLTERRTMFRHGVLLLLVSSMIGLVIIAQPPHPAKWMAAHVSGLLSGVLLIAFGGLWTELRLEAATRRRAMLLGLTGAWIGMVSNVYATIVNLPG